MSDMIRSARPRYEDFVSRVGESFSAYPLGGESEEMSWTLSSCKRLDPSNGSEDGFSMVFLTENLALQDTFRLVAADDGRWETEPGTVGLHTRLAALDPVGLRTFLDRSGIPWAGQTNGEVIVQLGGFESARLRVYVRVKK